MEFDSLAFSATRLAPSKEDRVYCPACQDVCEPEPSTGGSGGGGTRPPPTCPICSEKCVVRPSSISEEREPTTSPDHQPTGASVDPAAAVVAPATAATTTPPPRRPMAAPETPPAARRARASERVAREVLNFMAAIERGESLAVGLPLPPGAVLGGAVGTNGGGGGGRAAPALEQVVKDLQRIQVEENSWVLHQTVLRLIGGGADSELSIEAVFAPFSPPPSEKVLGPVVLSVPPTADKDLENEADVEGSVLLMDRGVCTFASKALRANAAGAAAAVVVQTHDVWPYVMEDSKGEAEAGGGLNIPVCMVSKDKAGEAIKAAVVRSAAEGKTVRAELSVSSSEKDCIVCQELYAVGNTLVRLPCGHLYHEVISSSVFLA
ncbi:unnamed protein product [Ectocarpus sp. 12 AP-2014]